MLARFALQSDEDAVVELARMQVAETIPHHLPHFCEDITRQTFRNYLKNADPTIFVVEDRRQVVGYLMAMHYPYAFRRGHFVGQEVIYVKPDKRGTRAAARLIKLYNQWSEQTDAVEGFMGVANGFQPERTAQFMRTFGYEIVGYQLRRIIDGDSNHGKGR